MNDKNIVVLGGGTAGWMTALFARHFFPNCQVTVVESDAIGILGAGEATVPVFHKVVETLGIDMMELIAKTGATFKHGIRFDNWNGDGKNYFHSFGVYEEHLDIGMKPHFYGGCYTKYMSYLIGENKSFNDATFPGKLAEHYEEKVPFIMKGDEVTAIAPWSIHFNSHNIGKYFREIGKERNINRVEGLVKQVLGDPQGDVEGLLMENGSIVPCDFIFDCSGFARLILGKHYNTNWKSYANHLPCNSAQAFFLPREEDIYAFTKSTAMKNGWQWNIPLQSRFGCGYVYDDRMTTNEEVREEIMEMHGHKDIKWMKQFKFNAGCYDTVWKNNCIGIGLSTSFLEPLESTSIWISALQLFHLMHYLPDLFHRNDRQTDSYNRLISRANEEAMNFIYMHYLTKRDDTEFWRSFRERMEMPELLKNMWDDMTQTSDFDVLQYELHAKYNDLFYTISWKHIAEGLNLLNREEYKKRNDSYDLKNSFVPSVEEYQNKVDYYAEMCLNHRELLNYLNERHGSCMYD